MDDRLLKTKFDILTDKASGFVRVMETNNKPYTIEDLAKGEKIIREAAREAGASSSQFAEVLVFVFSKGGDKIESKQP